MKKKITISNIILLLLIISAVKFSSCETEDLNFYIDCDYCLDAIPEWDTLRVSVTINDENPFVPLEFYIGDYDGGIVDWIDTARSEEFWLVSEVDVNYSVKATYHMGDKIIVAVDSDKIKGVDGEGDCYAPC